MEGRGLLKKTANSNLGFIDTVFSWTIEDIYNENLFKNKVEKIPESFQSVEHYLSSYVFPLLEETRAQLYSSMESISTAPFAEVTAFSESKPHGQKLYDVRVDYWRNRFRNLGKEPYKTLPGDILVVTDAKPEAVSDLLRSGATWTFAMVTKISDDEDDDESTSTCFKVHTANDNKVEDLVQKSLFVIYLINATSSNRIWKSLHMVGNLNIIEKILCTKGTGEENCECCTLHSDGIWGEKFVLGLSRALNESQAEAVWSCLSKIQCDHDSTVDLIWGPPGTGKTKTISMLLFTLLGIKCRSLTCAPTNVAITEVAARVLKLVKKSPGTGFGVDSSVYSIGDILLFGNKERLKVGSEIQEIYLEYRVQRLMECFGPLSGWRHCVSSMIDFLESCVSQYLIFVENELIKERERSKENGVSGKECKNETEASCRKYKSFLEFARDRFICTASPLRNCVSIFYTHVPKSYIKEHNFQRMASVLDLLDSIETLLFLDNLGSEELEGLFSHSEVGDFSEPLVDTQYMLNMRRSQCLYELRILNSSLSELDLPNAMNQSSLMKFCFRVASLIFCTASSSYKLHSVEMEPINFLVIDEAAQLKECESTIPLQLPGLKYAILIGDQCQLPAMVESTISEEAGFRRSLFERLSSLGHSKHLLNIQYRMHPSISFFPNLNFYNDQILDAPNVKKKNYEKRYLPGKMFGPYSFINIIGGREELDDRGLSRRNMVEVSVVLKILRNLYKAWDGSKQKLSIGVISPYVAQVVTIQEKLGRKYENPDGFSVKVKSIDGFQGGEEDIVIISTVRCNKWGSIGFMTSRQRTNVALTRARHCLWVLGNEKTLLNSESIWEALVQDAKCRQCFFNADEDKDLAKAILEVKKEFDQMDDLLNGDSILFRNARWKVLFSDNFMKSFKKITSIQKKKSVLNLLLKLSTGWRPKKRNVDSVCGSSSQILKQFKVEGLSILCTVDIDKEIRYIQVLKVWDILPLEDVPKLVKRLENIFGKYTDDFIRHCQEKFFEGNLEIPKSWPASSEIVRLKDLSNDDGVERDTSGSVCDGRSYVENSKVSESLLLMKFYSLSCPHVGHLLSDRDGGELDLPFEVTDEEREIILYPRSTFILGRSGTGKTTVLTMKLFKKEELHHMATEGLHALGSNKFQSARVQSEGVDDIEETKRTMLRQLFVTVSPKLCYAIKQHVSHLKRSSCGGKFSADDQIDIYDIDDTAQFKHISDSFVDISPKLFPLVITFHKFLMMLDGTLGNSYFDRFLDVRQNCNGGIGTSRSVALQTFIRTNEVNYDRFSSSYWPHFNEQLTKKLDSSRVFVEIISHIKGGTQALDKDDGRLSREDYAQLSEGRVSNLSRQKRSIIYDIYEHYERMKMENNEFDLADLVVDLHRRFRKERYKGNEMHFVYIDEVQDLTMSQIALFKYICENVEEGFVFSGDTAQTIARGIDFRFQDIRSLFYKKFVLESRESKNDERKEKGHISDIFNLSQNFRTHAGVLKLSQSIIELLYRFFPQSVDILKPETSLVYGEPPILLESGEKGNSIISIFGNSGNAGGNMVGFGAEQVILVRDDRARMEVGHYVGKQALVLTILECKGLEFQDVLLYDFFGSSPLKNQWRLIYSYMKEQNLLDSTSCQFPSFNDAKHNVLCSELKQLYVAITRTRQRLWICENMEDFSRPIFDYWKKKCLVQVRQLDDSLAQAMQVASSPEEWKSRGIKLFSEHNYGMATMCFERAGDAYWERRSKAASLRAAANRMRLLNPEEADVILREAAEIFESIGKAESAAECFVELREYERAGRIYLEKCGESELERAGECFCSAGCFELAADVYARGKFLSQCLDVCNRGKLFDMGLKYIQYWKQHAPKDSVLVKRSKEIDKLEQEFLERCALHYHKLKDGRSMMNFVRSFHSMDLKRDFLKSLDCMDELLLLEEESGNFLEAANIAKLRGDILVAADLLGKAGNFKEACKLTLCYVLSYSLWSPGNKGWPLMQFKGKEELLVKAKSFAKNESNLFYEFACTEADILLNEQSNVIVMKQQFDASQREKSVGGEILSVRMILDAHFHCDTSKYAWEDELIFDLKKHSDKISNNWISIETLVCFWNYWKDKIVDIIEYLRRLKPLDVIDHEIYGQFCLNYFGAWKQFGSVNSAYGLLHSDAHWLREYKHRCAQAGKLASIDVHQLVSAAKNYWCSELLCVGMKVLDTLEALYNWSIKHSLSTFCVTKSLCFIYKVAKYLFESEFLKCQYQDSQRLKKSIKLSTSQFFGYVFPLDWRKLIGENTALLRGTLVAKRILLDVIFENISSTELSYGQMGRVAMIILGSGKVSDDLYEKVAERFSDYPPWKALIETLRENMRTDYSEGLVEGTDKKMALIQKFHGALLETFKANWTKAHDYISPHCFLYLIERNFFLLLCLKGCFFSMRSSFVEWLIHHGDNTNRNFGSMGNMEQPLRDFLWFIIHVVSQLLFNKMDTMEWIKRSNTNARDYYQVLVLRLVVIICIVHVNFGLCSELLNQVMNRNYITEQLPRRLYDVIRRRGKNNNLNVNLLAEAFRGIDNPLVLVSLKSGTKSSCRDAIFIDINLNQRTEDIFRLLFPMTPEASRGPIGLVEVKATNPSSERQSQGVPDQREISKIIPPSNLVSVEDKDSNAENKMDVTKMIKHTEFLKIFEALKFDGGKDPQSILSDVPTIKVGLEKFRKFFIAVVDGFSQKNPLEGEDQRLVAEATSVLHEIKELLVALDVSEVKLESNISTIGELFKRLQSKRPQIECLLNKISPQKVGNLKADGLETGTRSTGSDEQDSAKYAEESSNSGATQNNSQGNETKGKGNKSKKNK